MAQTQIRGNSQIQSGSITEFELSSSIAGNGLSGGEGNPFQVLYGSGSNTAVQGNVQLTISGTQNKIDISGSLITLGQGGTIQITIPNDFRNVSGTFQYLSASNVSFGDFTINGDVSASYIDPYTLYRSFIFDRDLVFSGTVGGKSTWYISSSLAILGSELLFAGGMLQDSGTTEDYVSGERNIDGTIRTFFEFQYNVPQNQKVKVMYLPQTNSFA